MPPGMARALPVATVFSEGSLRLRRYHRWVVGRLRVGAPMIQGFFMMATTH